MLLRVFRLAAWDSSILVHRFYREFAKISKSVGSLDIEEQLLIMLSLPCKARLIYLRNFLINVQYFQGDGWLKELLHGLIQGVVQPKRGKLDRLSIAA